jgi:hypothetical protein
MKENQIKKELIEKLNNVISSDNLESRRAVAIFCDIVFNDNLEDYATFEEKLTETIDELTSMDYVSETLIEPKIMHISVDDIKKMIDNLK